LGSLPDPELKPRPTLAMEQITLVASLVFLAATSLATHLTQQTWIGFALAPVPLLFYRMDAFRMMLLSLACYLLFYEGFMPGSNFQFFNTPDSIIIVYIAMALFYGKSPPTFVLPVSAGLAPLYIFILYGLIDSIPSIFRYGFDFYVMRDVKNLLFLCLVPLLCRRDEPLFDPKNIYRILIAFVVFTALHSLVLLFGFFANSARVVSWNEVFLADAVLMIPILLSLNPERRTRNLLFVCLPICMIGLLATQTRGLWLSSIISYSVYIGIRLVKTKTLNIRSLLKSAQVALGLFVVAEIIFRITIGVGLLEFVQNRLMAHSNNELVNPYSSLGYRLHESMVVWEKRSWFGHGSGARLYLFFTQMGMSKFINWWSIHSEYFEILHKYGFIGLGIFMWFILSLIRRSFRIAIHGKAFPSAMGYLALTTLLNHCLVSITSGYLIRENVMLYMVLMVGIVERYYPRVFPGIAAGPVPAAAPASGNPSAGTA
jgi:hypothetical protein